MRVVRRLDGPRGAMSKTSSEDVGVLAVIVGGFGVLEDENFLHYSWGCEARLELLSSGEDKGKKNEFSFAFFCFLLLFFWLC